MRNSNSAVAGWWGLERALAWGLTKDDKYWHKVASIRADCPPPFDGDLLYFYLAQVMVNDGCFGTQFKSKSLPANATLCSDYSGCFLSLAQGYDAERVEHERAGSDRIDKNKQANETALADRKVRPSEPFWLEEYILDRLLATFEAIMSEIASGRLEAWADDTRLDPPTAANLRITPKPQDPRSRPDPDFPRLLPPNQALTQNHRLIKGILVNCHQLLMLYPEEGGQRSGAVDREIPSVEALANVRPKASPDRKRQHWGRQKGSDGKDDNALLVEMHEIITASQPDKRPSPHAVAKPIADREFNAQKEKFAPTVEQGQRRLRDKYRRRYGDLST